MAEGAKAATFPGFVDPCVPVERKAPPIGDTWLHEIKHDGYRAQAHLHDGVASVFTRRGNDWAARMPTIAASLRALPVNNVILDGELIAVDARGQAVLRAALGHHRQANAHQGAAGLLGLRSALPGRV